MSIEAGSERVSCQEEKIVAFLHDVPMKAHDWALDRLKEEGFALSILAAIGVWRDRQSAPIPRMALQAEEAGADTNEFGRGLDSSQP